MSESTGFQQGPGGIPEAAIRPAIAPILPFVPGMPLKQSKYPPCTVPNQTLYINNLNEKIKIPDLKLALETIFKTYGKIIEIRANASLYRKGQAYVTFENQEDATKALKEAQGFVLFSKPLMIQYARFDSYATILHENKDLEGYKVQFKQDREKKLKELAASSRGAVPARAVPSFNYVNVGGSVVEVNMPNKILFLQQIPAGVPKDELESEFSKYLGFVEVRTVPGKPSIAFVEYSSESSATVAKAALGSNWLIRPDQPAVLITFARK
ncbi:hypothetical protein BB560_007105 [Smittium megazygosporum]|uniref:RRM domain-containing protein n=1 Tax=Smittium megazygosporum TaxID=133381 RepID=A0A2T9XYQ2_9FUNG|nr:hypothetical protein BB560_007105 [Smittium megazygosporum]